jgi:hypothetical protein
MERPLPTRSQSRVPPVTLSTTSRTSSRLSRVLTFDDIAAKNLTLFRVTIPDDDDNDLPILLDSVPEKKKLKATHELSDVFEDQLPKKTIHIIVQRPPQGNAHASC